MAAIVGTRLRSSRRRRGRYRGVTRQPIFDVRSCRLFTPGLLTPGLLRPALLAPALASLALALAGCKKAEPVAAAPARPHSVQRLSAPPAPRERGEYSDMPAGAQTYSTGTAQAIAAEAQRGGPRGEPRIFENPQELNELSRGASPKFMNGQFRYYLASVAMAQPQGDCKQPLLAIRMAIENLHGTPTTAIYGEFTFTQTAGGDGSGLTETVAVPYHADILGPFSNKQGGLVYTTAYLQQTDPARDPERWAQIAAVNPKRLQVWFRPEAFYYGDGTQYAQRTGKVAALRDVLTCGGSEGARSVLK